MIVDLGKIHVANKIIASKGRWQKHPQAILDMNNFSIFCNDIRIKYKGIDNEESHIISPFCIKVNLEMPLISTEEHSPKVIDLSMKCQVGVSPIKLSLNKKHYSYFMECLDSNISYSDHKSSYFAIQKKEKKPQKQEKSPDQTLKGIDREHFFMITFRRDDVISASEFKSNFF
jgi:hypothetical protein